MLCTIDDESICSICNIHILIICTTNSGYHPIIKDNCYLCFCITHSSCFSKYSRNRRQRQIDSISCGSDITFCFALNSKCFELIRTSCVQRYSTRIYIRTLGRICRFRTIICHSIIDGSTCCCGNRYRLSGSVCPLCQIKCRCIDGCITSC